MNGTTIYETNTNGGKTSTTQTLDDNGVSFVTINAAVGNW
jgi:hypothetical protein